MADTATTLSAGGATPNDGSGGVSDGNADLKALQAEDGSDTQDEQVSYKTYAKTLDQLKSTRRQMRELAEQLNQLKADRESTTRGELEKQGDYRKLLEAERERAATLEKQVAEATEKLNGYSRRDVERRKLAALVEGIGGGDAKTIWRLADLDEIAEDPDSGEIDKVSLARYVERFRKEWSHVLPRVAAPMPNARPGAGGKPGAGHITESEYRKLKSSKDIADWVKREKEFPGSILWGR